MLLLFSGLYEKSLKNKKSWIIRNFVPENLQISEIFCTFAAHDLFTESYKPN